MKVWILNHYATLTFVDRAGRHYSFAKHLIEKGYKTTVFCASTVHNMDKQMPLQEDIYGEEVLDGIPYVFVKTPSYSGNGKSRIINMLAFAKNVISVAKIKAKKEKPDVIIASSVHPFTCVSGILIAKKLGVPCIVEIRDLWPESIVAYTDRSSKNPAISFLYMLEKWIYKKADKIIFTMEGGKDYIVDKKWDKANGGPIDLSKVYYINNGVDIEVFDNMVKENAFYDEDLENEEIFKVIYTGSIRRVNNIEALVHMAEKAKQQGFEDIRFLIYGDGDEKELVQSSIEERQLSNIKLKGKIDRLAVPYVLSKADIALIHVEQTPIMRYGCSLNKLFEYLASGKPIVSDLSTAYNIITDRNCGIVTETQRPEEVLEAIKKIKGLNKEAYEEVCENSRKTAKGFDFDLLTDSLIEIINGTKIR